MKNKPISVNYFFSRVCNYSCKFCFHYNSNNFHLNIEDAKKGLKKLKDAGMEKITFSGGEPFLYKNHLHELIKYCKEELFLESISIVSNGSLITEEWIIENSHFVDMLTISCDSFIEANNLEIGRGQGNQVQILNNCWKFCNDHNILFKINTVVNKVNFNEQMVQKIILLKPYRWKCFQLLLINGENINTENNLDAQSLHINDTEFGFFQSLNKGFKDTIFESNMTMRNSYYLLDEKMRFLDCSSGSKIPSRSILQVGVNEALQQVFFDEEQFLSRKGIYDWSKKKSICSN